MKKYVLSFFAGGLTFMAIAAVMPFQLHKDSSGNIPLESRIIASNGLHVITNFLIKAKDSAAVWQLQIDNTGTVTTLTNS